MIPLIHRGQREVRWNQLQCLMNNLKPRWENTNLYLSTVVFQRKLNQSKKTLFNNQALTALEGQSKFPKPLVWLWHQPLPFFSRPFFSLRIFLLILKIFFLDLVHVSHSWYFLLLQSIFSFQISLCLVLHSWSSLLWVQSMLAVFLIEPYSWVVAYLVLASFVEDFLSESFLGF